MPEVAGRLVIHYTRLLLYSFFEDRRTRTLHNISFFTKFYVFRILSASLCFRNVPKTKSNDI